MINLLYIWIVFAPILDQILILKIDPYPKINFSRIILVIIVLIFITKNIIIKYKLNDQFKKPIRPTIFILFFFGILLSAIRGYSATSALSSILDHYILPMNLYFIGLIVISKKSEVKKVFLMIIIVSTYSTMLSIYEYIFIGDALFYKCPWKASGSFFRAPGPFSSPETLGTLLTMAIPIVFYYIRMIKNRLINIKKYYILLIVFLCSGIFLTYFRTFWISGIFIITLMITFQKKHKILLLFIVILTAYLFQSSVIEKRTEHETVSQRAFAMENIWGRLGLLATASNAFKENIFIGLGYGKFNIYYYKYKYLFFNFDQSYVYDPEGDKFATHNSFISLLVDGGLFAFIPFIIILFKYLKFLTRKDIQSSLFEEINFYKHCMMGVVFAFILPLFSQSMLNYSAYTNQLFFFIMGLSIKYMYVLKNCENIYELRNSNNNLS